MTDLEAFIKDTYDAAKVLSVRGYHDWASDLIRRAQQLERIASQPVSVPDGWKLLKDTTQYERSWQDDFGHENGNYHCVCFHCQRSFVGHKRRVICRACKTPMLAAAPQPEPAPGGGS